MALYTVNDGSVISSADVNQFTNLLTGATTGIQITNAGRIRAQLAGATTGTGGYVGETPSLTAPTSGTFIAGDFASDANGLIWVCRGGGSPGTWSALPTQIATVTLSATTASVTFSSIPAFTRITLYWRAHMSASGAQTIRMTIDGNSANYLWSMLQNSSTTVTGTHSGASVGFMAIGTADGATANFFGSGYQVLEGWNTATGFLTTTGTWQNFSTTTVDQGGQAGGIFGIVGPHTSLTLTPSANSFAAGSTFSIFGSM